MSELEAVQKFLDRLAATQTSVTSGVSFSIDDGIEHYWTWWQWDGEVKTEGDDLASLIDHLDKCDRTAA